MTSAYRLVLFSTIFLSVMYLVWQAEAVTPTLSECQSALHSLLPECVQLAAGIPVNVTESVINAVSDCGGTVIDAISCVVGNLADYATACSSELSAAGSCLSSTLNTTSI